MPQTTTKKQKKSKKYTQKEYKKLILENIKLLAIKIIFIVILIYVVFFWVFGVTRLKDRAMKPNVADGDLLLYYRLDKNYEIEDIVTFKKDDKRYVLRIIATAGQTITLNSDGDFIIDGGTEKHQTYFKNEIPENSQITYPYTVEPNHVFVVGDYRLDTNDSRTFGAIDVSIIDGKVISLLQTKNL